MADWLLALVELVCAAHIGTVLGAWIARRDDERRATRDAINTVIAESDVYRTRTRRAA